MDSKNLQILRIKSKMTKEDLSQKLDISLKTLSNWESALKSQNLGKPYILAAHAIFFTPLLQPVLRTIAEKANTISPSEFICVWIVCGTKVILLPNVALHTFQSNSFKFYNDEIRKPLSEISMTVAPLQNGEIMNLVGNDILKHPERKIKDLNSHYFTDGICKSMLYIPLIIRSSLGPRPVALLALENRGDVRIKNSGKTKFIIRKPSSKSKREIFYSKNEIALLQKMFEDIFKKDVKDIYDALDCLSQIY